MVTETYNEYWQGYVAGHAKLSTRIIHYFGLFYGQLMGFVVAYLFAWWLLLIINPLVYYIAYASHEHIEGNTNEPFAGRPLWSAISFFRMLYLDSTGQLVGHLQQVAAS